MKRKKLSKEDFRLLYDVLLSNDKGKPKVSYKNVPEGRRYIDN
jgi:hypothetical protein